MTQLAINKYARSDYEILEIFEGGLVLTGAEVKSIKMGHAILKGAFVQIEAGELWLKNAYVAPYAPAAQAVHDTNRNRKVLVHAQQLRRIVQKREAQGLTLVPLSFYTHGANIKLEFALARGKKKYEKRETIKKREFERHAAQQYRI